MRSEHLLKIGTDSRITGSLAGLGKSRLALLTQVYSSQKKLNGTPLYTPRARTFFPVDPNYRVQAVQGVIFLTGGGFQPNSYRVRFCSSRGKTALHGATYKRQSSFEGYEVKND